MVWEKNRPVPVKGIKGRAKQALLSGRFARLVREMVAETPCVLGDAARVTIGEEAVLSNALLNTSSGTIALGKWAFLGSNVSLLTGTHDVNRFDHDRRFGVPREGRDIVVGDGAWIASNVTVLGPCRIGEHAVVATGAVVTRDVEPFEIVGGVPAKTIGWVSARP